MRATYQGPADVLVLAGKEYRAGDAVPSIGREVITRLLAEGHRFDVDITPASAQPATVAQANTARGELAASVTNAAPPTPAAGGAALGGQPATDTPGEPANDAPRAR